MTLTFYGAAAVAVLSTLLMVTRRQPVHALLYLVVSFLALAVVIFLLGAAFVAALEVVIYAGAIIVLFLFVVTLLDLAPEGLARERRWLARRGFIGPLVLSALLVLDVALLTTDVAALLPAAPSTRELSLALYGPYVLAVELASMLLLAGLVGAFHLGRHAEAP